MLELGTLKGDFAGEIVKLRPDIDLFCVDSWKGDFKWAEDEARRTLEGKAEIIKAHSADAAASMACSFDLIYIDAAHDYTSVSYDLRVWWPMVKKGGILSGHDYENVGKELPWGMVEVKKAVDEWAKENELEVSVVEEIAPSWWVRK